MRQNVSRFGEIALLVGAAAVLGLAFGWLSSRKRGNSRPPHYEPPFDIVTENSEESFPASDPPSFAFGVR